MAKKKKSKKQTNNKQNIEIGYVEEKNINQQKENVPLEIITKTEYFYLLVKFFSETKSMSLKKVESIIEENLKGFFGIVGTSMKYDILKHEFGNNQYSSTCIIRIHKDLFDLFWAILSFSSPNKASIQVLSTSPFLHDLASHPRSFFNQFTFD